MSKTATVAPERSLLGEGVGHEHGKDELLAPAAGIGPLALELRAPLRPEQVGEVDHEVVGLVGHGPANVVNGATWSKRVHDGAYPGHVSATAIDLAWLEHLAEESGAKVEVDVEGSVIVSPATDEHLLAAHNLQEQLNDQLRSGAIPGLVVLVEGPWWTPRAAERPSYIPDVTVVRREALGRPRGVFALEPAPLLVVEVISPESRRRDLGEKSDAYFDGGALAYWTVEIPALTSVTASQIVRRQRGRAGWEVLGPERGRVNVTQPFAVQIDLDELTR